MRLVGNFKSIDQARIFYAVLHSKKIHSHLEMQGSKPELWVIDENKVEEAKMLYEEFLKDPSKGEFQVKPAEVEASQDTELSQDPIFIAKMQEIRTKLSSKELYSQIAGPVTRFLIVLCFALFIMVSFERYQLFEKLSEDATSLPFTRLEQTLLLGDLGEVPLSSLKKPELLYAVDPGRWQGIYMLFLHPDKSHEILSAPLFPHVSKGEIWRLFTPALLHVSILHILFNMLLLWILGKQIEERVGLWRYVIFVLIIALFSNVAQYLMAGGRFMGFSGIISGMAGFIWVRQKFAPWEGYPLQKGTLIFLLVYVLGIAILQVVSFLLEVNHIYTMPLNIANTAHIAGAIVGMVLGSTSYFARNHT